jgi:hypothetical protein
MSIGYEFKALNATFESGSKAAIVGFAGNVWIGLASFHNWVGG